MALGGVIMSVFITSDLHLGHYAATKFRKEFKEGDQHYHDFILVENINERVDKRDKLFILGDVAFSDSGLKWLKNIRCKNIELILGNHDKYPLDRYYESGITKIHGFRGYRNLWLSHCPIHPQELYRKRGNVHGHIHRNTMTKPLLDPRYFNVNVEFHNYYPVPLEKIETHFDRMGD